MQQIRSDQNAKFTQEQQERRYEQIQIINLTTELEKTSRSSTLQNAQHQSNKK